MKNRKIKEIEHNLKIGKLIIVILLIVFASLIIINIVRHSYPQFTITKEVCHNETFQRPIKDIELSHYSSTDFYDNVTLKITGSIFEEDWALSSFCAYKIGDMPLAKFIDYYEIYPTEENTIGQDLYNPKIICSYVEYKVKEVFENNYAPSNFIQEYPFKEYYDYINKYPFNESQVYIYKDYFLRIINTNSFYSAKVEVSYPIHTTEVCEQQEVEFVEINCLGDGIHELKVCDNFRDNKDLTKEWLNENCKVLERKLNNAADMGINKEDYEKGSRYCKLNYKNSDISWDEDEQRFSCYNYIKYKCGDYTVEVLR